MQQAFFSNTFVLRQGVSVLLKIVTGSFWFEN